MILHITYYINTTNIPFILYQGCVFESLLKFKERLKIHRVSEQIGLFFLCIFISNENHDCD